jgi:hypothetical protein
LPIVMAVTAVVGLALSAFLPWVAAAVVTGLLYLALVDRSGASGARGLRGLIERNPA